MSATVLVCGKVFDGASDSLTGPAEILVEGNRITSLERCIDRPPEGRRPSTSPIGRVSLGFIDTHVHLTMDAAKNPNHRQAKHSRPTPFWCSKRRLNEAATRSQ